MNPGIAALILATGLVAGFLNTVAGGGSLLSMPMLIFVGLPSAVANGTNRVAILFQCISAVAVFRRKGFSDFGYGSMVTLPALGGAWLGAQMAIHLDDRIFNRILAVVMLAVMGYT
ncbi:MAG: TSUP family transporter, partial [Acidobacteriota bacterium]